MKRLFHFLGSFAPGVLGSSFAFLVVGRSIDSSAPNRRLLLLFGALYGMAVVALIRLFKVARWCLPFAGLLSGALPVALFFEPDSTEGDKGGAVLLFSLLGFVIGLLEWGRLARIDAEGGA